MIHNRQLEVSCHENERVSWGSIPRRPSPRHPPGGERHAMGRHLSSASSRCATALKLPKFFEIRDDLVGPQQPAEARTDLHAPDPKSTKGPRQFSEAPRKLLGTGPHVELVGERAPLRSLALSAPTTANPPWSSGASAIFLRGRAAALLRGPRHRCPDSALGFVVWETSEPSAGSGGKAIEESICRQAQGSSIGSASPNRTASRRSCASRPSSPLNAWG